MKLTDRLFAAWQYLVPHHLLSRLMGKLTHCRNKRIKLAYMRLIIRRFGVNMVEAAVKDLDKFEHFNAFFTRALKPGARPIAGADNIIVSPVDGFVSQMGYIEDGCIFQAKGHRYSLSTLLGGDDDRSRKFIDGEFATLYLSPKDYHRIHMPIDGELMEMRHIPGRLFSVNPATVRTVPGLFARNERVVCFFETAIGPVAMILVGAIFVASIETVWQGVITPPSCREIQSSCYGNGFHQVKLHKGEEMGRFNMGSTVIVLFGKDKMKWVDGLGAESHVMMGQAIGATL